MKLEIDIDEDYYKIICKRVEDNKPYHSPYEYEVIADGKPLEQEPTTKNDLEVDCISRAEAIRVASGYCHPSNVAKELAKLPSVTPQEPRKGYWIKHENPSLGICMRVSYECSCCGIYQGCENFIRKSFCPNCGADMRESEE